MKRIKSALAVLAVILLIFSNSVFASFPVKSLEKKSTPTQQTNVNTENVSSEKAVVKTIEAVKKSEVKQSNSKTLPAKHDDEFWITLVLWLVLGGFAAHRWYRGKPVGWNILFILTAGGCGVWAIVDLINILKGDF